MMMMKMMMKMMKMLLGCALCLMLLSSERVESRTLTLASCSVNVHIHELRKYYAEIRLNAMEGDSTIGVKLLNKSLITDIQDGQTCCFLRLVLRFYVERVFSHYAAAQPQQRRCASALANAFVSIRKDIHRCHCQCEENTQRKIDAIHAEFIKLDINQATHKAVGELDTVLDWLEEPERTQV